MNSDLSSSQIKMMTLVHIVDLQGLLYLDLCERVCVSVCESGGVGGCYIILHVFQLFFDQKKNPPQLLTNGKNEMEQNQVVSLHVARLLCNMCLSHSDTLRCQQAPTSWLTAEQISQI